MLESSVDATGLHSASPHASNRMDRSVIARLVAMLPIIYHTAADVPSSLCFFSTVAAGRVELEASSRSSLHKVKKDGACQEYFKGFSSSPYRRAGAQKKAQFNTAADSTLPNLSSLPICTVVRLRS
eukprot:scpid84670/ scgid7032/ 